MSCEVGGYYRCYKNGKPDVIEVIKIVKFDVVTSDNRIISKISIHGKRNSNNIFGVFNETSLFEKIDPESNPEYFL